MRFSFFSLFIFYSLKNPNIYMRFLTNSRARITPLSMNSPDRMLRLQWIDNLR